MTEGREGIEDDTVTAAAREPMDPGPGDRIEDAAATREPMDPGPGAPAVAPRRLMRSRTHRMVAGVAGGMGEHFSIDPLLFRLAFVGLSFAGGVGILLYLAAWILVPEQDSERSLGEDFVSRPSVNSTWVGIGLLVLGLALLPPLWSGDPAVVWAVVLITAGVLLYRSSSAPPRARPAGRRHHPSHRTPRTRRPRPSAPSWDGRGRISGASPWLRCCSCWAVPPLWTTSDMSHSHSATIPRLLLSWWVPVSWPAPSGAAHAGS